MAENKYPSMQRVVDMALETSVAVAVVGPRTFDADELADLMDDVRRAEGFLALLTSWVREHKTYLPALGTFRNDYTAYNLLRKAVGTNITIGEMVITDLDIYSAVLNVAPTDVNVGVVASTDVKFGGTTIASITASTYAIHSFLRSLPTEVYHAMGSMLEEVASTFYKGEGPTTAITSVEIAALIRLQDKIVKSDIEAAVSTPIGCKDGVLSGPEAHAGRALARQHAEAVLRQLCPTISSWLLDLEPAGVRAYTTGSA
jgi:hypothetical protein